MKAYVVVPHWGTSNEYYNIYFLGKVRKYSSGYSSYLELFIIYPKLTLVQTLIKLLLRNTICSLHFLNKLDICFIYCINPTVLSTSLRKTFFAWHFNSNENLLIWLTISYQKPFVFSVSVFYSQIFTLKLSLWPKIGLAFAISILKWFFGIFVWENIFHFSLLNLNYWCFGTILWKFQKNRTSGPCWKSSSKLPSLQISA